MLIGAAWPKPVRRPDMTARQCRTAVHRGSHQIGAILSAARSVIPILLMQTRDHQSCSGHDSAVTCVIRLTDFDIVDGIAADPWTQTSRSTA
jgi:hypothetical protein